MNSPAPKTLVAPIIDTERLRLRAHRPEDLADSVAMFAHPDFLRHVAAQPVLEEEVWARILRHIGHWSVFGFGLWAVEEKATGRFAGEVGIANFKREIDPLFEGAPEAVWGFAPWSHGKGFATEAVRAVHTWVEGQFGPTRTVCMIRPANVASIRVAEKLGYKERHRPLYRGAPMLVLERLVLERLVLERVPC